MSAPPLVDVAMSFVRSSAPALSDPGVRELLRDSFSQFLLGVLPHDALACLLQQHIGTVQPLERIDCILHCPENPPLPPQFARYRVPDSLTNPRRKPWPWAPFEDIRLLAAIHRFGTENWGSVAQFVGNNRTRAQCSQRWVRGLDPRICKEQWSTADEDRLCELVRAKGTRLWAQVAADIGNRCDVQCRYHFFQMYRENRLPADLQRLVAAEKPPVIPRMPAYPPPVVRTVERVRANSIGSRPPPSLGYMPGYSHGPRPQAATPPARAQRRLSLPMISEPVVDKPAYKHDSDGEAGAPPPCPESDLFEWAFTTADEVESPGWWV